MAKFYDRKLISEEGETRVLSSHAWQKQINSSLNCATCVYTRDCVNIMAFRNKALDLVYVLLEETSADHNCIIALDEIPEIGQSR